MDQLPPDIIYTVFQQLSDHDQSNFSRVSKFFASLYGNSIFWISKIRNKRSDLLLKENMPSRQLINIYKSLPKMGRLFIRPYVRPAATQIDKRDDIIQVAIGENYLLYLTIYRNLYLKENTKWEITEIDLEGKIVVQFSAGPRHAALVTDSGEVYIYGENKYGQLGLGDLKFRRQFVPIPGFSHIVQVSCGIRSTAMVSKEGKLYTFGYNKHFELGNGDNNPRSIPQLVSIPPIKQVAIGNDFMIVISKVGDLYKSGTDLYFKYLRGFSHIESLEAGGTQVAIHYKSNQWSVLKNDGSLGALPIKYINDIYQISLTSEKNFGILVTKSGSLYKQAVKNNWQNLHWSNSVKFGACGKHYIAYIE